jgi:ATP-binding cassette subfamily C (CFTR/MRP) protein 1
MLFWLRDITLMLSELRAASALHTRMLDAVMKAPMSFFDATPTGRILNRFSNDQESLDATLPRTLNQLFSCALRVGGTIAMICFVSPAFFLALLPIAYLYWQAQQYYSKSSRELKRIESTTKSPLYSHFGESIAGSSIIRAAGEDARFRRENCERVDRLNNLFGLINDCNRWLAIRLELCGNGPIYSMCVSRARTHTHMHARLELGSGVPPVPCTRTCTHSLGH